MTELMRRRRALMWEASQSGGGLPAEYQQVEWIGNDGRNQNRINTGITVNNLGGYTFNIVFSGYDATSAEGVLFGTKAGSSDGYGFLRNGTNQWFSSDVKGKYGFSGSTDVHELNDNTIYNLIAEYSNDGALVVGAIGNVSFSGAVGTNISGYVGILGCGSSGGFNYYPFNGRVYSAVIKYNNTIVWNGIPCYRKSDGVIGMYDTVSDVFYTNAGTGTFTKGGDVNV